MDKFYALSHQTRRKILELLAKDGPLTATEICEKFSISPPAISQHLKILREVKLVEMEKRAQKRIYRINPEAMLELEGWASQMMRFWNERFDALEQVLEAEKKKSTKKG